MRKKQRQVRAFSIIASIIMIFSLITPGLTFAESNGKVSHSLNDSKVNVQNKVTSSLQDQLENEDKVTFLIKFSETADVMGAAQEAKDKAQNSNLSALGQEHAQRSAVISELKSTAMESQQKVTQFLEEQVENGNAEDIRSYHIVNGMAVTATKEVAEKLASFPDVEKLLPNEQRELIKAVDTNAEVPKNETAEIEWNIDRIGAPAVWNMGIDGQGTVVASIDTGADWEHPALQDKYRGYDPATGEVDHTYSFYDPVNGEEEPYDDDGHGTHVTGTMVGSEADGSNQVGVAPGAQWISVQAFTAEGAYDADLLAAAEWILAPGGDATKAPDVVNNSWSGGSGMDEWYRDAVTAWRAADIFPAFAAGNKLLTDPGGPGSVAVPANYPESFATGATDINDNLADFSLLGPSPYDEIKPDISAPGVNIRSSVPGDGYDLKSGTSMASPAVAGVVALLKSANAGLDVDTMEDILMEMADSEAGTDDNFPESPNNGYGHGIVDAYEAVSSVISGLGTIEGQVTMEGEDTEPPTYNHEAPAETYEGTDLDLNIQASDNVSVTSVELHYGDQVIEATRTSGDLRSGEYSATVPGEDIEEGTFTYHWVINDFGDNTVTTEEHVVDVMTGITVGYEQDFESYPTGWVPDGIHEIWEWGEPTSGPEEAASGDNVYATILDGAYPEAGGEVLSMPPIDLPDGEAYLQFKHWYSFYSYSGFTLARVYVKISTDNENWTILGNLGEDNEDSDGWEDGEISLSEYAGQRVYITFDFQTYQNLDNSPGYYLDDVVLSDESLGLDTENTELIQSTDKITEERINTLTEVDNTSVSENANEAADKKEAVLNGSELPLDARVSVVESGRSTNTDPQDGSYTLRNAVGTFTLVAEAYGFYPEEQSITVEEDNTVEANFTLEEMPEGTVSGTVTSEKSGEPIEGARVLLVEDANVDPVQTDTNGNYEITGYEGDYTIRVIAQDFHSKDVEVTVDGGVTLDIELEPLFTVPGGEIYYDDGTAENANASLDAGNKWAVKMSLPEDRDSAFVTDGVFQFHDTDFPHPGDTRFAVEVWSAGDDGMPDERLAGPIDAEAIRDLDEWTVVDLRDESIQVDGDFFMVYVQTQDYPNVPGLAMDVSSPNAERSYEEVGGFWSPSPPIDGNYMIRARVAYEVETPVITSPEDGLITNKSDVTVEGTASPETTVEVLQNGEEAGSVEVGEDGTFAVDTELDEGENEFVAVTYVNGEQADESDPVTATLDTEAPDLTVTSPEDGENTNRETATVEGTVSDDHLDTVTVNGQETAVSDGEFSLRILLNEGENVIEVEATDLVGNTSTETITVYADYTVPEIFNLTPDEDVELETGQSVMIEFESEPGLRTSFIVHLPLTDFVMSPMNATELPMMETTPGNYVGYWTVPQNAYADGAVIEVIAKDGFGNETREQADGRLFVNLEE